MAFYHTMSNSRASRSLVQIGIEAEGWFVYGLHLLLCFVAPTPDISTMPSH